MINYFKILLTNLYLYKLNCNIYAPRIQKEEIMCKLKTSLPKPAFFYITSLFRRKYVTALRKRSVFCVKEKNNFQEQKFLFNFLPLTYCLLKL